MKMRMMAGLMVVLGVALVFGGCASTSKGMSDEELIAQKTEACLAAATAKDIDKLLTYYSEKFEHPQFGDKQGLKDFLDSAKESGYLDGLEIDMADAATTIDGETATVSPVYLSGSFGSASIDFTIAKENGTWMITGMDIQ